MKKTAIIIGMCLSMSVLASKTLIDPFLGVKEISMGNTQASLGVHPGGLVVDEGGDDPVVIYRYLKEKSDKARIGFEDVFWGIDVNNRQRIRYAVGRKFFMSYSAEDSKKVVDEFAESLVDEFGFKVKAMQNIPSYFVDPQLEASRFRGVGEYQVIDKDVVAGNDDSYFAAIKKFSPCAVGYGYEVYNDGEVPFAFIETVKRIDGLRVQCGIQYFIPMEGKAPALDSKDLVEPASSDVSSSINMHDDGAGLESSVTSVAEREVLLNESSVGEDLESLLEGELFIETEGVGGISKSMIALLKGDGQLQGVPSPFLDENSSSGVQLERSEASEQISSESSAEIAEVKHDLVDWFDPVTGSFFGIPVFADKDAITQSIGGVFKVEKAADGFVGVEGGAVYVGKKDFSLYAEDMSAYCLITGAGVVSAVLMEFDVSKEKLGEFTSYLQRFFSMKGRMQKHDKIYITFLSAENTVELQMIYSPKSQQLQMTVKILKKKPAAIVAAQKTVSHEDIDPALLNSKMGVEQAVFEPEAVDLSGNDTGEVHLAVASATPEAQRSIKNQVKEFIQLVERQNSIVDLAYSAEVNFKTENYSGLSEGMIAKFIGSMKGNQSYALVARYIGKDKEAYWLTHPWNSAVAAVKLIASKDILMGYRVQYSGITKEACEEIVAKRHFLSGYVKWYGLNNKKISDRNRNTMFCEDVNVFEFSM